MEITCTEQEGAAAPAEEYPPDQFAIALQVHDELLQNIGRQGKDTDRKNALILAV